MKTSAKDLKKGLIKTVLTLLIVLPVLAYAHSRYSLGVDIQVGNHSVPHTLFIVDSQNQDIRTGRYVAFKAERMVEPFVDGMTVIKQVAAMQGDHVKVTPHEVYINGVFQQAIERQVLGEERGLSIPVATFDGPVPEGHLFVLGTHPRSYDSRYWGFVEPHRVIGRAYGIKR